MHGHCCVHHLVAEINGVAFVSYATVSGSDMQDARLPMLDVFAGIGGFSLALRDICRTVGYCEISQPCQEVLRNNMRRGLLETAPIYDDIASLPIEQLTQVKIVTAGFPCQDISLLNKDGIGLHGEKSKLFFTFAKAVRKLPNIRHILLENSPQVKTKGLSTILSLLKRAGFHHIAFGNFSAAEVGALHVRRRWFCLASRDSTRLLPECHSQAYDWSGKEPCRRLLPRRTDQHAMKNKQCCRLLGNAVVPTCVMYAYNCLRIACSEGAHKTGDDITVLNGKVTKLSGKSIPGRPAKILPYPTMRYGDGIYKRGYWMTPVYSSWCQYRKHTQRSTWLLSNQIYYEIHTPVPKGVQRTMLSTVRIINPCFIEYLMGYPMGWVSCT